jgi:hypothetical protein
VLIDLRIENAENSRMTIDRAIHSLLSPARAARLAGALAVLAGGLVLVGGTLDLAALKNILPGWLSVKPNPTLAFVLTGPALLLPGIDQGLFTRGRSQQPWTSQSLTASSMSDA